MVGLKEQHWAGQLVATWDIGLAVNSAALTELQMVALKVFPKAERLAEK